MTHISSMEDTQDLNLLNVPKVYYCILALPAGFQCVQMSKKPQTLLFPCNFIINLRSVLASVSLRIMFVILD